MSNKAAAGSSWANAAGRKAGGGNTTGKLIGRGGPQTEPKIKPQGNAVDPLVAERAALQLIAREALEYAMASKDLEKISNAIEQHKDAAVDSDALWRANTMKKELLAQAKHLRKMQAEAASAGPKSSKPTEAEAIKALEAAMASQDLGILTRIWVSTPRFGYQARIWTSAPGFMLPCQDLGIQARIFRHPGNDYALSA